MASDAAESTSLKRTRDEDDRPASGGQPASKVKKPLPIQSNDAATFGSLSESAREDIDLFSDEERRQLLNVLVAKYDNVNRDVREFAAARSEDKAQQVHTFRYASDNILAYVDETDMWDGDFPDDGGDRVGMACEVLTDQIEKIITLALPRKTTSDGTRRYALDALRSFAETIADAGESVIRDELAGGTGLGIPLVETMLKIITDMTLAERRFIWLEWKNDYKNAFSSALMTTCQSCEEADIFPTLSQVRERLEQAGEAVDGVTPPRVTEVVDQR